MKKINSFKACCFLIILSVSFQISSCKFYKSSGKRNNYSQIERFPGRYSPYYNHYILHYLDQTVELKSVVINKSDKTLSGTLAPFEGLQLEYYKKINPGGLAKRKRFYTDREATNQVHLYLNTPIDKEKPVVVKINLKDITQVETTKNAEFLNFIVAFGVTSLIVGAAVTGFLIIACGCPHVYIDDGTSEQINTTLFTGAKSAQLERHDYKVLPDYFKDSTNYSIRITNDEDENQFTNLLELMAVYHDENTKIVPDKTGRLHSIKQTVSPSPAFDNSLKSIHNKISVIDNYAYCFNADSLTDLSEAYFTFSKPERVSKGKLMLRLKNSKWSGLVYNEFSSYFGKWYQHWLKNNNSKPREAKLKWMKEQGINLLVDIKTPEGWKNIEAIDLVGEINYQSLVVPIQFEGMDKSLEIRLRAGFMFWELDYIGLDFSEDVPLNVQKLKVKSAYANNGISFVSELNHDDDEYMVHKAELSSTQIKFEPIQIQLNQKRTLILHSKGYYTDNKTYAGKMKKMELNKCKIPGGLSRLSKQLFKEKIGDLVIVD